MSAIRDSVAGPSRTACSVIRSSWSGGASMRPLGARVGHRVEHDQVAQPVEQVGGEPARVVPGLDHPVDVRERGRASSAASASTISSSSALVGDPEQPDRARVGHALGAGAGDQLVEHRQRVAHRAAAGADHERKHGRLDR